MNDLQQSESMINNPMITEPMIKKTMLTVAGDLAGRLRGPLMSKFELIDDTVSTELAGTLALLGRPATWTPVELARLINTRPRRPLVAGFTLRYHPGVRRLASAVLAGEVGLPWAAQLELVIRGDDHEGSLADLLAEAVDTITVVLGLEVRTVLAHASAPLSSTTGTAAVTLVLAHDVGVSITLGRIAGQAPGSPDQRIRVMGNEGVLLTDLGRPALLINGGAASRRYGADPVDGLLDELERRMPSPLSDSHAPSLITAPGQSADPGLASARVAVAVVAAAGLSITQRRVVPLSALADPAEDI